MFQSRYAIVAVALWMFVIGVLSACGSSTHEVTASQLVSAGYADCGRQGLSIAEYLDTGNPVSYDPSFGDERQTILAMSGAGQQLAIRRYADQYIMQCDAQEYTQQRQLQTAMRAENRRVNLLLAADALCKTLSNARWIIGMNIMPRPWNTGAMNTWDSSCIATYNGRHYIVAFSPITAKVVPSNWIVDASQCAYNSQTAVWHPDTMICSGPGM